MITIRIISCFFLYEKSSKALNHKLGIAQKSALIVSKDHWAVYCNCFLVILTWNVVV